MQPQATFERCPHCGKITSMLMINPTVNAAAPAVPHHLAQALNATASVSVAGPFHIDGVSWANAAAAAPATPMLSYEMCTCSK